MISKLIYQPSNRCYSYHCDTHQIFTLLILKKERFPPAALYLEHLATLPETVLIEHFQVWKFMHFTMRNCTPINHNLQYFHWNEVILMRWTLISKTQYNCRKQPLFPWIRVWEEMSLVWWVMWHYYCNFFRGKIHCV